MHPPAATLLHARTHIHTHSTPGVQMINALRHASTQRGWWQRTPGPPAPTHTRAAHTVNDRTRTHTRARAHTHTHTHIHTHTHARTHTHTHTTTTTTTTRRTCSSDTSVSRSCCRVSRFPLPPGAATGALPAPAPASLRPPSRGALEPARLLPVGLAPPARCAASTASASATLFTAPASSPGFTTVRTPSRVVDVVAGLGCAWGTFLGAGAGCFAVCGAPALAGLVALAGGCGGAAAPTTAFAISVAIGTGASMWQ